MRDYSKLRVKGFAFATGNAASADAALPSPASTSSNFLPATNATVSDFFLGPSRRTTIRGAVSQWPGFRLVVQTSTPMQKKNKKKNGYSKD